MIQSFNVSNTFSDDGKFKQIYYYSKNFLLDWNDALVFCRQFDMNLAVIETKSEETALFALISKDPKYKVEFASIGGTKVNSKVWYWLQTEEKINYNMQWGRGEPSNFQDDDELCLGIVKKGTQTGFCDMACTTGEKRDFICEARFSI